MKNGVMMVQVTGNWPTWNFSRWSHGPTVPAGVYDLECVDSPTTGRPTMVLSLADLANHDPQAAADKDVVGVDEEYLRRDKIRFTIVQDQAEPQPA